MEKITKKEFKDLHSTGKLELICSGGNNKEWFAEYLASFLLKNQNIPTMPVTRVDLCKFDTVYKDENILFVEFIENNSVNTILYKER